MYLAPLLDKKHCRRYLIRHSFKDGDCYRSRDLFDLGNDPSRYIRYPGGNGFYIDAEVLEGIAAKGVDVSQDDLEPIFMPFLDPHIRRVIEGFDRRSRHSRRGDICQPGSSFHRFDRYRLHFLKLGHVVRRDLGCTPDRFYAVLGEKSRDEIEFDFTAAERMLKPHELARYTYQIFDLERFFSQSFAHSHPEGLDQDRMDRYFVDCLCALNRDEAFWANSDGDAALKHHLIRYAVMYFDNPFPAQDPFQDLLRDFMNRHRVHRSPASVQIALADAAHLFGVSVETLKKMDCRSLTRQYRLMAKRYHPDIGGDQHRFIRLNAAYHKLLNRKSRY